MLFETIATTGHEQVVFCQSKDAGLKAIIAIHNTVLGPALGGLRMWPYKTDEEALNDVLRLSRGMTYTNAVNGEGSPEPPCTWCTPVTNPVSRYTYSMSFTSMPTSSAVM